MKRKTTCPLCQGKMIKSNGRYGLFYYCDKDGCVGKRDNTGKQINSYSTFNKQAYARRMQQIRDYGKFDD